MVEWHSRYRVEWWSSIVEIEWSGGVVEWHIRDRVEWWSGILEIEWSGGVT